MQRASFWTRVGHWIRPSAGDAAYAPVDGSAESADTDLAEPVEAEAGGRPAPTLVRRRGREDTLTRLEEGFEKVVNLCDSLNVHFTLQEERSAQIADSLGRVAADMSGLARSVGDQSETLRAIVEHLESGNHRAARVEELCSHFAKLTEAQRQSLAVVSQQVESSRRTDEEIAQSLRTFQESICVLGQSCAESTDALRQMRGEASARDDRLAATMDRASRRFLWLFGITLAVAVAGVAGILMSALR